MTSGTTLAIEFNIAFPNSTLAFVPVDNANTVNVLRTLGYVGSSWSSSGITVIANETAHTFRWLAIGY